MSCSNDEKVKLWSTDGQLINSFGGHSGFVFTCAALLNGDIASGGDDCTVRIWNVEDGSCKQVIPLPRTVWSIT